MKPGIHAKTIRDGKCTLFFPIVYCSIGLSVPKFLIERKRVSCSDRASPFVRWHKAIRERLYNVKTTTSDSWLFSDLLVIHRWNLICTWKRYVTYLSFESSAKEHHYADRARPICEMAQSHSRAAGQSRVYDLWQLIVLRQLLLILLWNLIFAWKRWYTFLPTDPCPWDRPEWKRWWFTQSRFFENELVDLKRMGFGHKRGACVIFISKASVIDHDLQNTWHERAWHHLQKVLSCTPIEILCSDGWIYLRHRFLIMRMVQWESLSWKHMPFLCVINFEALI